MKRSALVLLVLLCACREPTVPVSVNGLPPDVALAIVGTYQLYAWKDKPLPTLYAGSGMTCDVVACVPNGYEQHIVGGALELNPNGTFHRTTVYRESRFGAFVRDEIGGTSGTYTGSMETGPVLLVFRFTENGVPREIVFRGVRTTAGLDLTVAEEVWHYAR